MDHIQTHQSDRARHRAAIESIIARYPGIAEHELYAVFDYFRNEATRADRRLIAGNRAIRPQFRQICRDHRLDRLGPLHTIVAVLLVFAAVLTVLFILLNGTEL